jgi:hypothetical protein
LNYQAFRDLLYLNEGPDKHGHSRFKDVALQAGIERAHADHSLGAVFTDVNRDGRPDLYVANDLDPNRLYVNEPGRPLGFHFVEKGAPGGSPIPNAGMGIAAQDYSGDGRPDLFVTNSRSQGHAAFRTTDGPALPSGAGVRLRGRSQRHRLGRSWVDLGQQRPAGLVLANGAIPVTNVKKDAGRCRCSRTWAAAGSPTRLRRPGSIARRSSTAAVSPRRTTTTTGAWTWRSTRLAAS